MHLEGLHLVIAPIKVREGLKQGILGHHDNSQNPNNQTINSPIFPKKKVFASPTNAFSTIILRDNLQHNPILCVLSACRGWNGLL